MKALDHLHDGDALDHDFGLQALKNLLLRWPANVFWRQHHDKLLPALRESVAFWQAGDASGDVHAQFEGCRLISRAIADALGRELENPHLDSLITGLLMAEPRFQLQPA